MQKHSEKETGKMNANTGVGIGFSGDVAKLILDYHGDHPCQNGTRREEFPSQGRHGVNKISSLDVMRFFGNVLHL